MLYLGIDQHSKQITVCVRDEAGDVVRRRQVSTRPEKIQAFFEQLTQMDSDFMAIVEVCGFNDWLIDTLKEVKCGEIVLVHPNKPSKRKTDRLDANKLSESLWTNRERFKNGERLNGLRRVYIASKDVLDSRQLTATRKRLGELLTRVKNRIHRILHRHNLMWEYPTKTFPTKAGRKWLAEVSLPRIDRMEMDILLDQWNLFDEQIAQLQGEIEARAQYHQPGEIISDAELLATAPGLSHYSGLALASRIGPIERFSRPASLSNFFGITPGCRNSGNAKHRPGSITKEGSSIARFHLGQMVVHVLKQDEFIRKWYRKIKARRGSKIARVAVMRRMTTVIWHMLTHKQPYCFGGLPPRPGIASRL